MTLSVPEIIAALKKATNNDPYIDSLDFKDSSAKEFIEFCTILYERGIDHGLHTALSNTRLALEDAGQTMAASLVGRLMND